MILAWLYSLLWYGDNNNTHCFFCNMNGYNTCMDEDINHEDIRLQLNIYGCTGSEQFTISCIIKDYATKCDTKGDIHSDNWDVSFQSVIKILYLIRGIPIRCLPHIHDVNEQHH